MDVEDHQLKKTAFQPAYPVNRLRRSDRYRIIFRFITYDSAGRPISAFGLCHRWHHCISDHAPIG